MPRRACTFRQQDVTRAVRAAKAAGVDVARIEIDKDGRIVLVACNAGSGQGDTDDEHLDRELAEFEARHGEG